MVNDAHASRECISRYEAAIVNTTDHISRVGQDLAQVDDSIQEMTGFIQDLEVQEQNCNDAISHADSVIADLEKQLADLQAELAVTPQEIPETYTDAEGNSYTEMVPNPAYYALVDQIQATQAKLAQARATRDAVESVQREIRSYKERFRDATARMTTLRESISHNVSSTVPVCQGAVEQLQKIDRVIEEYQSVLIGAFYDHTHGTNMSVASFPTSQVSSTVNYGGMDSKSVSDKLIDEQGKQVPGYEGTCGPCTIANLSRLLGVECDEAGAVNAAKLRGLCTSDSDDPRKLGGMSIKNFMKLGQS
ncbi:MAG: hypothetical protein RBR71_11520 [Gudongella sp.]|nr:hypothetical protein [Gudongella sp.]